MKRTLMGFIASVLAILLSANCVFAQNTAATLPFTDDFSSNSGWTYLDVNPDDYGLNSWYINGGQLFVRPGDGNYSQSTYNVNECATSYVYRDIQLGTSDSIKIEFDITVGGEYDYDNDRYYDYAAVLFAPTSQTYTASNSCSDPACINSQYVIFGPMSNLTSVHRNITIANPSPNGTYKIVFVWHNDGNNGTGVGNTSAIIDNLSITEVNALSEADVDMSKYITLTVSQGDSIRLGIQASADNTPVKIESGSWDTIIAATTNIIYKNYKSQSTTMTVYGDVKKFYCGNNGSKITAIDASHSTALTNLKCYSNQLTSLNVNACTLLDYLDCEGNQLTSLNVSGLTNLKELYCDNNQLTSLNVSGLTNLEKLYCDENQLTSLDISGLTNLIGLDCCENQLTSLNVNACTLLEHLICDNNQLTSLDVSTLTNLKGLYCYENQLTSLNISGCDSLYYIVCYDNQLSTQALDNLYCQLPDRTTQETEGEIVVSLSATDEIVLATNKTNAADKNWSVSWRDTTDYSTYEVVTVGTYVCGEEPSALANVEEQSITLYPNPAKDEVVLQGIKGERVTVFDANGRIVKQEVINERLDIRDLESGVYYLQVKDVTEKLVKQ